MYFDTRLWSYTQGVRLRIFGAVAIGILAVLFGIARLVLLGWLIARIFQGVLARHEVRRQRQREPAREHLDVARPARRERRRAHRVLEGHEPPKQ